MFSSHDATRETLEATKQEQERWLQEGVVDEKGRTVLTILYLAVLGLCFVVPIFYYFRLHCEERRLRQLREIEIAAIRQTLEESENENREEARAARRKYREERRAQIIQLFSPVRMFLKKEKNNTSMFWRILRIPGFFSVDLFGTCFFTHLTCLAHVFTILRPSP